MVPDDEELKREILRHFHDHELAGHPGIANTITAVTREFWWPEIRQFTTAYVRGCAVCQSTKPNTVHPKPPILPITHEQQQYPFQTIAMDLITDLPVSRGYVTITELFEAAYLPFYLSTYSHHTGLSTPSHVPLCHMTPLDPCDLASQR